MTVLSYNKALSPKDSRTHIRLPFEIKKECAALIITFSYLPKTLKDQEQAIMLIEQGLALCKESTENAKSYLPVNNLITLSLDSPYGYVGAAHRHNNNQTHTISASYSDIGFEKIKIIPGEWCLTLSCHYIAEKIVNVSIEAKCE